MVICNFSFSFFKGHGKYPSLRLIYVKQKYPKILPIFLNAWVLNTPPLVIYQCPRRGLFISAKIYPTLTSAVLEPGHFILGRRHQLLWFLVEELDSL